MATNVIMPSLGFDMTEGKLARWLKKEGERVEKGQAIAEIETEKATVEIEATSEGILQRIVVTPGQTVPVGTVMGIIAEPGEKPQSVAPASPAPAAAPPPPAPTMTKPEPVVAPPEGRVKASPLARKMAESAGIDLATIKGSGPGGRVMERDVQAAIGASAAPSPSTVPGDGQVTPLTKMRQAIARRMTESKATVPHFYETIEVNMTEALKMREQLNQMASEEEKLSINDLIVAAAAKTLKRFPVLNASFRDGGIAVHDQVNIGIAVALEDGLITPVLRDADKKTLKGIAIESKALSERARTNHLRSDDLGSGTFTVSNLGMFGVDQFVAIIVPPEAAILAVGAVTRRPIAVDSQVQIAPMMQMTLSVDHRVADGAQAGRFLQELRKLLESPVNLLV